MVIRDCPRNLPILRSVHITPISQGMAVYCPTGQSIFLILWRFMIIQSCCGAASKCLQLYVIWRIYVWMLLKSKLNRIYLLSVTQRQFFCCERHKVTWERGGTDILLINLDTRWRLMVSFTHRPLYTGGQSPQHPLHGAQDGFQNHSGRFGEEKSLTLQPIAPLLLGRQPSSLVTMSTTITRIG